MRTRTEFLADCLHLLQINMPVDFSVGTVINNWDAMYVGETRRHIVRVAPQTERCHLSLIAHELVHAALTERHPNASDHGPVFKRTANRLQRRLEAIGWELHDNIYMKGIDI